MYRRDDDRYDSKRGDRREERDRGSGSRERDRDDYRKSSRRNRWDDRQSESKRRDYDDKDSRHKDRDRKRSRSRSPAFRKSFTDGSNPSREEYYKSSRHEEHSNNSVVKNENGLQNYSSVSRKNTSWSDSSDDDEQFSKSNTSQREDINSESSNQMKATASDEERGASSGISLKLAGSSASKPVMPLPKVISVARPVKATNVAAIFNTDDDEEPEEMPPECKMRMKNVGRETKTSEGPNSFGKTKIGFCNMSHLTEKKLEGKTGASKRQ